MKSNNVTKEYSEHNVVLNGTIAFNEFEIFDLNTITAANDYLIIQTEEDVELPKTKSLVTIKLRLTGKVAVITLTGSVFRKEDSSTYRITIAENGTFNRYLEELQEMLDNRIV